MKKIESLDEFKEMALSIEYKSIKKGGAMTPTEGGTGEADTFDHADTTGSGSTCITWQNDMVYNGESYALNYSDTVEGVKPNPNHTPGISANPVNIVKPIKIIKLFGAMNSTNKR